MLPEFKTHTRNLLRMLDAAGLTNNVLVITRWRVSQDDCGIVPALSTCLGSPAHRARGVTRDTNQALFLFRQAASKGNVAAQRYIDHLGG